MNFEEIKNHFMSNPNEYKKIYDSFNAHEEKLPEPAYRTESKRIQRGDWVFQLDGAQPQLTTVSETPEQPVLEMNSINEADSSFEEVDEQ